MKDAHRYCCHHCWCCFHLSSSCLSLQGCEAIGSAQALARVPCGDTAAARHGRMHRPERWQLPGSVSCRSRHIALRDAPQGSGAQRLLTAVAAVSAAIAAASAQSRHWGGLPNTVAVRASAAAVCAAAAAARLLQLAHACTPAASTSSPHALPCMHPGVDSAKPHPWPHVSRCSQPALLTCCRLRTAARQPKAHERHIHRLL